MKRRWSAFILLLLLCAAMPAAGYAHNSAGEHWKDIRYVLFGDENYSGKDADAKKKRQAIEYASQICIDQFGGFQAKRLELLKMRVGGLSAYKIEDLNLDATPNNHREYTHLGWTYEYASDSRNKHWKDKTWPARQEMFRKTVEGIFNFNGMPGFLDPLFECDPRCDRFCALVYYVHLLGDHIEFTSFTYHHTTDGKMGKDRLIPLGSPRGLCLISEIIDLLAILFPDQDTSELKRELEEAKLNICAILNSPEKLKTDHGFAEYTSVAKEVREILHRHLPRLLANEDFFRKVFY